MLLLTLLLLLKAQGKSKQSSRARFVMMRASFLYSIVLWFSHTSTLSLVGHRSLSANLDSIDHPHS